jgi:hypothetical protein
MSDLEIARFASEHVMEAAEVTKNAFGGTVGLHAAYLDWKYVRNPYISEPLLYVALHRGRVVATRGFYGTCWTAGRVGPRYVLPAASDTAILTEYRDRGLDRELNDVAFGDARGRGYTHVVNLSANPQAMVSAMVSFGWKAVVSQNVLEVAATTRAPAPARTRLQPANVRSLSGRLRARLAFRSGRVPRALAELDNKRSSDALARAGIRVTRDAAELATIAARSHVGSRLGLAWDEEFCSWRFVKPGADYRFLLVDDDSGFGFLVLGASLGRAGVSILGWEASSAEVAARLLDGTLSHRRSEVLDTWSGPLSRDEVALLTSRGFTPVEYASVLERRRKALLVRPLASGSDEARWELDGRRLDDPAVWRVSAAGSDAY